MYAKKTFFLLTILALAFILPVIPLSSPLVSKASATPTSYIGVSGYPTSTAEVQDTIDFMTAQGLNVYRMSFNPSWKTGSGWNNPYSSAYVTYFLTNAPANMIVIVDRNHLYPPTSTSASDARSHWTSVRSDVFTVLATWPNNSRVWVELINEYVSSDFYSRMQTLVTEIRDQGYTNSIVCNKWEQAWTKIADSLDSTYQGYHFYFNSWSVSGAISQMNTALGKGIKLINTEIGADYREYRYYSSGTVGELNSFLSQCSALGVGNTVWMNENLDNWPRYNTLGLIFPDVGISYTLTVAVNGGAGGYTSPVAGVHSYDIGETVIVHAYAYSGYVFRNWTVGATTYLVNPISVGMDASKTLTAFFDSIPIPLANYTLTVAVNVTEGYANLVSGDYSYPEDTSIELDATANPGYFFWYWGINGVNQTGNPITVAMSANTTATAYFGELGPVGTLNVYANYPYISNISAPIKINGYDYSTPYSDSLTPVGDYLIEFGDVGGYLAPASQTATVSLNTTVTASSSMTIPTTTSLGFGNGAYINFTYEVTCGTPNPYRVGATWYFTTFTMNGASVANYSVTSSVDMTVQSYDLAGWLNYTVSGAGTQSISVQSQPQQMYVDGVLTPVNSGWTYTGGLVTVIGIASSNVSAYIGATVAGTSVTTVTGNYTLLLPQAPTVGPTNTFVAKSGTIWNENRTNTSYILAKDFAFNRISFFGQTYTSFDKKYSAQHYGYFSIWVESPTDTTVTISEWFPVSGYTIATIVFGASATPIVWDLYSEQFTGSVVAEGAVSSQVYATYKLQVTTPAKGGSVTIRANVTPIYMDFYTPEIVSASITNMDNVNWLFSGLRYYDFNAEYWDGDGYTDLATVDLGFKAGPTWINVSYSFTTGFTTILSAGDVDYPAITIQDATLGTVDLSGNSIPIVFHIYLTNYIADAADVDLYLRATDNGALTTGWTLTKTDYFYIYNIGGATETLHSGAAGHVNGGDTFEIYAQNGSWVAVNQTWRWLQSYHSQFSMRFTGLDGAPHGSIMQDYAHKGGDYSYSDKGAYKLDIGVYYQDSYGVWVKGWNVVIIQEQGDYGPLDFWVQLNCTWYAQGVKQGSSFIMAYSEDNPLGRLELWTNLWFNQENASTLCGGRVNPYYYGVTKTGTWPFLGWITGDWAVKEMNQTNSMGFAPLKDSVGDVISSQTLSLMKVYYNLSRPFLGSNYDFQVTLTQFDTNQPNCKLQGPMSGIPTPLPDKTIMPTMPTNSLFAPLYAAFAWVAGVIVSSIVPVALAGLSILVGFIDTIAGWAGHPGAFTAFLATLNSFWGYMITSLSYLLSIVTSLFSFMASTMTYTLSILTTAVSIMQSMITGFSNVVTGVGYGGVNLWVEFGGNTWLTLFMVLYPMWLIFLWEEKGLGAVIQQLQFIINVLSWITSLLLGVVGFVIDLIFKIMEAIPVIE